LSTIIKITPPGKSTVTLASYDQCTTSFSDGNRSGSFNISFSTSDAVDVDRFPFGSDVLIDQNGSLFRGWVMAPGKSREGLIKKIISLSGADYGAKTQKILINESYSNQTIDSIIRDLFGSYVPWATTNKVDFCNKTITITFNDKFLFDAIEQLTEISGYKWYVDADLDVNFFYPGTRINPNIMQKNSYKKATANISPDVSNIVNRLYVKGGKATSLDFTQTIIVDGSMPIPLYYSPKSTVDGVIVTVNGSVASVGIENIDPAGTKDFLLNFSEKLLIPDLITDGTGTIVYRYEYPIKLMLEDTVSQNKYGVFDDVLTVDTDDRLIAQDLGLRHLSKYKNPINAGSIEPFSGNYYPGELLYFNIPELNLDEYLQIKDVSYTSLNRVGRVEISLTVEAQPNDTVIALKGLASRIQKLEQTVFDDTSGNEVLVTVTNLFSSVTAYTPDQCGSGIQCGDVICKGGKDGCINDFLQNIIYGAVGTGALPAQKDVGIISEIDRQQVTSINNIGDVVYVDVLFSQSDAIGNLKNAAIFLKGTESIGTGQVLAGSAININKTASKMLTLAAEITVYELAAVASWIDTGAWDDSRVWG